jgi:hypothetical protein
MLKTGLLWVVVPSSSGECKHTSMQPPASDARGARIFKTLNPKPTLMSVSSWKCVANRLGAPMLPMMCSAMAQANPKPS